MRPCGAVGLGLLRLGLLLAAVCGAAAELHTLRYIHTAMTDPGPGQPWYVDVGYVDGELFVHYNSTARRYVPRTEWMAAKADQQYWDEQTQIAQGNERSVKVSLDTLQERYNQTGGSHTAQWMYGCDILEDGTIRGYHQEAYDGRDFIALDKDMKTFTAAVPEAVPTKRKWEEGGVAEGRKQYLEETCVEWLRRYVEYGKAELGRRARPSLPPARRAARGASVGEGGRRDPDLVLPRSRLLPAAHCRQLAEGWRGAGPGRPVGGHRAQRRRHLPHLGHHRCAAGGRGQVPVPRGARQPAPARPLLVGAATAQPGAHRGGGGRRHCGHRHRGWCWIHHLQTPCREEGEGLQHCARQGRWIQQLEHREQPLHLSAVLQSARSQQSTPAFGVGDGHSPILLTSRSASYADCYALPALLPVR